MNDITIPIWLLAVSSGVPCISFLSLLLFILRKIRKPQKDMFVDIPIQPKKEHLPLNHQFHNELLQLQIDTVFNGLIAIITSNVLSLLPGSLSTPGFAAPASLIA